MSSDQESSDSHAVLTDIRALVRELVEIRDRVQSLERRIPGALTARQADRAFDLFHPEQVALRQAIGRLLGLRATFDSE